MLKAFSIIFPVFLISACVHNKTPREIKGELATSIYPDGVKQFQYRLIGPERGEGRKRFGGMGGPPGGGMGRGGPPPGGGRGGPPGGGGGRGGPSAGGEGRMGGGPPPDGDKRRLEHEQMLEEAVEKAIAEANYCREGFTLYKEDSLMTRRAIRGECKELATEEDRKMFPNKNGTPGVITIEDLDQYLSPNTSNDK